MDAIASGVEGTMSARLRKQDKNEREEWDSLLDTYMHALETGGTRLKEAA